MHVQIQFAPLQDSFQRGGTISVVVFALLMSERRLIRRAS